VILVILNSKFEIEYEWSVVCGQLSCGQCFCYSALSPRVSVLRGSLRSALNGSQSAVFRSSVCGLPSSVLRQRSLLLHRSAVSGLYFLVDTAPPFKVPTLF